ncbi:hypothetical protein DPEC_G00050100 [Dallia pectoralis]|uniref:Uncharacterized protein n=1 Tax=Dallia pectoralis TaxID=75939 RepID=A0ACC2HBU1_DALPE|nr:hypothetical protein DPEC_G00050100 [Dallia pectoralis]
MNVLNKTLHLRWTHGSNIVYNSNKNFDGNFQITSNGSLLLENVQRNGKGTYKATVHNHLGKQVKSTTTELCVLSPVSKPQLTDNCIGTKVSLRCEVGNTEEVMVTWSLNGVTLPGRTDTTLEVTKPEGRYACTASNPVSQQKSDEVNPKCPGVTDKAPDSKPQLTHECIDSMVSLRCEVGNTEVVNVTWNLNGGPLPGGTDTTLVVTKAELQPEGLYACVVTYPASWEKSNELNPKCPELWLRMEMWMIVTILSGGGGLLLILLIIIAIVCRRRVQRKRRIEVEQEMRLTTLTQPTRQGSLHHHNEKCRTRPQNRASPRTTPNSRPQARPRPQQLLPGQEEPIPMPRTTGPKNHKCSPRL